MSQCSFQINGQTCQFPGAFSEATKGDGRWFCAYHRIHTSPTEAADAVRRSIKWASSPNKAEEWVKMRKAEVYGNGDSGVVARLRATIAAHRVPTPSPDP